MKAYEWKWYYSLCLPGIAVTAGDADDRRARLHMAPIMLSHDEREAEYHLKVKLPVLGSELASSFVSHTSGTVFVAPQLRLMRCDAEVRAECWLTPEIDENDDTALILASIRGNGRYVVASGAEILFETSFWQWNEQTTGQVVLAKVPRGGLLILQERSMFGSLRSEPWYPQAILQNDGGNLNEYTGRGRFSRRLAPDQGADGWTKPEPCVP